MDALIFYHFSKKLTGSLFNAFEYYITILEHNPKFKLIFINLSEYELNSYIIPIFENRYLLNDINFKKNIILLKSSKLIYKKFDRTLILDYGTIWKTKGFLNSKEITVISEKHTDDPNFMFSKKLYNVTYYGEMPFTYHDHKYRMKLAFDRFKKVRVLSEGVYINSPYNEDTSFIDKLNLDPNKKVLFKSDHHLQNMFENFDEYIYYHANKWFDPHPRLFLECYFYNKKIRYYNKFKIKDGSYYRYQDLKENGLKNRTLSNRDTVVRRFI